MSLIDTHAHLDDPELEKEFDRVIYRAKTAGIERLVTIATGLDSSHRTVALAAKDPMVFASVGVDHYQADKVTSDTISRLEELAQDERVVAIGEIGLDYYRHAHAPRVQLAAFEAQAKLAMRLNLPIVVHSRQASEDTIALLRDLTPGGLRGVIHCFGDTSKEVEKYVEMGLFVSFAGNVTYPTAKPLQQAAECVPDDLLLLETDCPYLSPESVRSKRNEPAHIALTAAFVAKLRGISTDDIARITTRNAMKLFWKNESDGRNVVVYPIRDALYINLTNRCSNNCTFCARQNGLYVKGHELTLEKEPTAKEVLDLIDDPGRYREFVFCGFGEPTVKLDVLLKVAADLKRRGARVRLNTNGTANLIHGRDVVPELAKVLDSISISLNSADPEQYSKLCQPQYGLQTYPALLDFIRRCVELIPDVTCTTVAIPGVVDVAACEKKARELGAKFRMREFNKVG